MEQKSRDLLNAPPQKVILMYQAIIDMINEGSDINNMKVIDITKRAGIGKGTAYEYFSSKEEIITKALLFEMIKHMNILQEMVKDAKHFESLVFSLLDYGEKNFHEGRTFFMIVKVALGAFDISESLKLEFIKMKQENLCVQFTKLQEEIMELGVKEGIIKETNLVRQRMVFYSQMVAYSMYLSGNMGSEDEMSLEEAKKFVYDGILKQL